MRATVEHVEGAGVRVKVEDDAPGPLLLSAEPATQSRDLWSVQMTALRVDAWNPATEAERPLGAMNVRMPRDQLEQWCRLVLEACELDRRAMNQYDLDTGETDD